MNLAIDIGNTLIKAAVFQKGTIVENLCGPLGSANEFISGILKKHSIQNVILSSVANHPDSLATQLASGYNFVYFGHTTVLPFKNAYSTPETLGKDRLSAVAGAYSARPGENILVVDAGTCIKYDFINSGGEYLGGAISPGIAMRYRALEHFTHKLPLLKAPHQQPGLIGTSTDFSIHSGVINGAIAEVEGTINSYIEKFENISVFLTGGDIDIFKPVFSGKNNIFADPLLVLKGLNFILEHNVGKTT